MDADKKIHFNGEAILLGAIYYISIGLWKKGLLLGSASLVVISILMSVVQSFFSISPYTITLFSFVLNIGLFGIMGDIDTKRKEKGNEVMWKELPSLFDRGWVVVGIFVLSIVFNYFVNSRFVL